MEYPFQLAFQEFRSARSIDTQKNHFKGLLEAIVKFNAAFHTAWILKEMKSDIPLGLRVQLVQMYQKPPSLGFCNMMSSMVNRLMLKAEKVNSLWLDYARFFEQNQGQLNNLIKIRNKDAHASIVLDKQHMAEIKSCFEVILSNPLFQRSSLIFAHSSVISDARIINTRGLENLNQLFVIIKPDIVYNGEEWSFSGEELCLMPFVLGVKKSGSDADEFDLVFWNQRNGKRGVFQSYINSEAELIEVDNITELSGFPYEDWKRAANPVYLNYLKSRNLVLEEMLDDQNIRIHQWYEEMLLARRLEKEIQLEVEERISDYDYGYGMSMKLKSVQDRESLVFYHTKLVELRHKGLTGLPQIQANRLGEIIYDSIVFMFRDAINNKDKTRYNEFFKIIIDYFPRFFYLSDIGYSNQNFIRNIEKICGGKESTDRYFRNSSIEIRLYFIIIISIGFYLCFAFTCFISIGFVLILCLSILIKKTLSRRIIINKFNLEYVYTKKEIESILMLLLWNTTTPVPFGPVFWNNKYLSDIIDISNSTRLNNSRFDLMNEIVIEMQSDYGRTKTYAVQLSDYLQSAKDDSSVDFDRARYEYFNENRMRYLSGEVHYSSLEQRDRIFQTLDLIFYLENLLILRSAPSGEQVGWDIARAFFSSSLNRVILSGNKNSLTIDRYNFFFGSIAFYSNDLSNAISYWSEVKYLKNFVLMARYNIAMCKGALGRVNEFYRDLHYLAFDLDDECPGDVEFLRDLVKKRLGNANRNISDYLNGKSNYVWNGQPSFTIINWLLYTPKSFVKHTIIHKNTSNEIHPKTDAIKSESVGSITENPRIRKSESEQISLDIDKGLKDFLPQKPVVLRSETRTEKSLPEHSLPLLLKDDPCGLAIKIQLGHWLKDRNDVYWAKKNLDVNFFRNGDVIPHIKQKSDWAKASEIGMPAWCYYKNDSTLGEKEGKLYNWHAVNDPRGLAPQGWRVANSADWSDLISYFGGEEGAIGTLQSHMGWMLGSRRKETGTFSVSSNNGWWSASEGRLNGYAFEMKSGKLVRESYAKGMGLPVLCLKE